MRKLVIGSKDRQGFTLVELTVLIVVIGVLAAFGVPRFIKSVERSKAAEAFTYLSAIRAAQERYHAQEGTFADSFEDIDVKLPAPRYFNVSYLNSGPDPESTIERNWSLTLIRSGNSGGYGPYTVTFNEKGYDPKNSTIASTPEINPLLDRPGQTSP